MPRPPLPSSRAGGKPYVWTNSMSDSMPSSLSDSIKIEQKTTLQAQMLANRLGKKFKHLSKWARRTGAGAFRLYDRDIPEIPLVLDYYGDENAQGAVAGALYQRPYEKDPNEEDEWLAAMSDAAADALGISDENMFIKQRRRQRGKDQYEKQSNTGVTRIINECGLRFKVNLSDYLDTGLFPDRRLLRSLLRQDAAGKRVLNLFSYTGSFSVAAAAGGASATCSVDMSNTYTDWAADNFNLNKYQARRADSRNYRAMLRHNGHLLVRSDVLAFLKEARRARCAWDTIILDPPAFSNSKKMSGTLDLRRDHLELLAQCLALLAPGGKLWFSVSARRFNADADALEAELGQQFPGLAVADYTRRTTDEDFRGRRVPQTFLIKSGDG